jgi:hypothetical protein
MFIFLSTFAVLAACVLSDTLLPCDITVPNNTVVIKEIIFTCDKTGLFQPTGCQPNAQITMKENDVTRGDVFVYHCYKPTLTEMKLDVTGCVGPDGKDMPLNTPVETQFKGVYTCTNDSGTLTRSVQNVCVQPNHVYLKKDESVTTATVKLTCKFENGEYHAEATACISSNTTINVNSIGKLADGLIYKCVADPANEALAHLTLITDNTCGTAPATHEIGTTYTLNNLAYRCVEKNLTAVQELYGCADQGVVAANGTYGKFGSTFYYCDASQGKNIEIHNTLCGIHELMTTYNVNHTDGSIVQTHCYYDYVNNKTYEAQLACVVFNVTISKNAIKEAIDSKGVAHGYQCSADSNGNLVSRQLSDAEYAQYKKDNGIGDGETETGTGGQGDGGALSTTTEPDVTTAHPDTTAAHLNTTQVHANTTTTTAAHPNTTAAHPNTTTGHQNITTTHPKPPCVDLHPMCASLAQVCQDDNHGKEKNGKGGRKSGGRSSSSESDEDRYGKHKRPRRHADAKESKAAKAAKGKENGKDCDSKEKRGHGSHEHEKSKESKGKGKSSKGSGGSRSGSHSRSKESGSGCKQVAEKFREFVQTFCPMTCKKCVVPTTTTPPRAIKNPWWGRRRRAVKKQKSFYSHFLDHAKKVK